MKPLALIALNLATVALALVAYDVVRSEPVETSAADGGSDADGPGLDAEALDDRLRALEGDRRRVRRPDGTDPTVLARLEALEALLPRTGAPHTSDGNGEPVDASSALATPDTFESEPTADEIQRFRRLAGAVRRADAIEKHRDRIDATLDALPLSLTTAEREGVHEAYTDFQPRVSEIWGETKSAAQQTVAAGGTVDRATIFADTTQVIQQAFAGALSSTVSPADASTIAEALMARGK